MSASLEWADVRPFFETHGCVIADCPEMDWYRDSWSALENAGLACSEEYGVRDLDQSGLKLRAVCLLAMYLGIYQAAGEYSDLGGYFSDGHELPLYLETLDLEMEDIWNLAIHAGWIETDCLGYGENEEADDEVLLEIAQGIVKESDKAIFEVLKSHYGGELGLFVSLWNSRFPMDRQEDIEDAISPTEFLAEKVEIWEYVRNGMVGWSWL